MLKKTSQYNYKNNYYIIYENDISWLDLINSLLDNGYVIDIVMLSDSAGDLGMKAEDGNYPTAYFLDHYDELTKYVDTMKFYIGNGIPTATVTVNDHENSIVLYTHNPELDLNDMIKEKELK